MTGAGPRYRLRSGPLSLAAYVAVSRLTVKATWARGGGGFPRGVLFGGAIGAVLVLAAHLTGVGAEVVVWADRPSFDRTLSGWGVAGLAMVVAGLGGLVVLVQVAAGQRALLKRFHAATRHLHVTHELEVGDSGIVWAGPDGRSEFPWTILDGPVQAAGTHFILVSGTNTVWFTDAEAGAGRDAILSFIRDRVAAAGEGVSPP